MCASNRTFWRITTMHFLILCLVNHFLISFGKKQKLFHIIQYVLYLNAKKYSVQMSHMIMIHRDSFDKNNIVTEKYHFDPVVSNTQSWIPIKVLTNSMNSLKTKRNRPENICLFSFQFFSFQLLLYQLFWDKVQVTRN